MYIQYLVVQPSTKSSFIIFSESGKFPLAALPSVSSPTPIIVQSLSHVQLFLTLWTAVYRPFLTSLAVLQLLTTQTRWQLCSVRDIASSFCFCSFHGQHLYQLGQFHLCSLSLTSQLISSSSVFSCQWLSECGREIIGSLQASPGSLGYSRWFLSEYLVVPVL